MAEALIRTALSEESPIVTSSNIHRDAPARKNIVFGGIISVDAAPSDTTLYTVTAGKIFYVTSMSWGKQDAGSSIGVYDSAGDSATGTAPLSAMQGLRDTPFTVNYHSPVPYKTGFTVKGTELSASKAVHYTIQGYEV